MSAIEPDLQAVAVAAGPRVNAREAKQIVDDLFELKCLVVIRLKCGIASENSFVISYFGCEEWENFV